MVNSYVIVIPRGYLVVWWNIFPDDFSMVGNMSWLVVLTSRHTYWEGQGSTTNQWWWGVPLIWGIPQELDMKYVWKTPLKYWMIVWGTPIFTIIQYTGYSIYHDVFYPVKWNIMIFWIFYWIKHIMISLETPEAWKNMVYWKSSPFLGDLFSLKWSIVISPDFRKPQEWCFLMICDATKETS